MENPWGISTGIRPVKIARCRIADGCDDENIVRYYDEKYKICEDRARLCINIARLELDILKTVNDNDICVYIGIPFCKTRCLYCSFVTNSAENNAYLKQDYITALEKEIKYTADIIKKLGLNIICLYIGGGTPTALSCDELSKVISDCKKYFDLSKMREFTVEAGRPDTIDSDKLLMLKNSGVTRISINPQTMNDKTLKLIGRFHTARQIEETFALARQYGFDDINMDVIAGLPGENADDFKYTLSEIQKLDPESVTVHTMCIKRGSRLHETLGDYCLTDGAVVAEMIDYSKKALSLEGYHPYYLYRQKNILGNLENIGYSKPKKECIYNIMIMEELSSIISLGCGGVTKIVNRRYDSIDRIFNVKEAKDYILRIDEMCKRKDGIEALVKK